MLAQLTYTSADYGDQSGWHIRQKTTGMDEKTEAEIFRHIRSVFQPLVTLPGYATEEEIRSAEVRLTQVATPSGPVLVHCAQAGPDTTGRPNTFSQAFLFPYHELPPFLGVELWRSDHWLMPLGSEAVAQALFDEHAYPTPNEDVDFEAFVDWVYEPENRAFLLRVLDLLDHTWDPDTVMKQRPLIVIPVPTCDEAAQWMNALSRLMAPARAARLSWSLWERVTHVSALENLRTAGLDIVFIPESDCDSIDIAPEGVTLLRPADWKEYQPESRWARFAASALADDEVLDQVYFGSDADIFHDIEDPDIDCIFGQGDAFQNEWLFAMSEAATPGLLSRADASLTNGLAATLLATSKAALDGSDLVKKVIRQHFDAMSDAPWEMWRATLEATQPTTVMTSVLSTVIEKYFECSRADVHRIREAQPLEGDGARLIREWLESEDGRASIPRFFAECGDAFKLDSTAEVDLWVLRWMNRQCGDCWQIPEFSDFLEGIAQGFIEGSILDADLAAEMLHNEAFRGLMWHLVEGQLRALPFIDLSNLFPAQSRILVAAEVPEEFPILRGAYFAFLLSNPGYASFAKVALAALWAVPVQWKVASNIDRVLIPAATFAQFSAAEIYKIAALPLCAASALTEGLQARADVHMLMAMALQVRPPARNPEMNGSDVTREPAIMGRTADSYESYEVLQNVVQLADRTTRYMGRSEGYIASDQSYNFLLSYYGSIVAPSEGNPLLVAVNFARGAEYMTRYFAFNYLMFLRAENRRPQVPDSRMLRAALKWCMEVSPSTLFEYFTPLKPHAVTPAAQVARIFISGSQSQNYFASTGEVGGVFGRLMKGSSVDYSADFQMPISEVCTSYAGEMFPLVMALWQMWVPSLTEQQRRQMVTRIDDQTQTGEQLLKALRKMPYATPPSDLGRGV